jgi:hypothetical protein
MMNGLAPVEATDRDDAAHSIEQTKPKRRAEERIKELVRRCKVVEQERDDALDERDDAVAQRDQAVALNQKLIELVERLTGGRR